MIDVRNRIINQLDIADIVIGVAQVLNVWNNNARQLVILIMVGEIGNQPISIRLIQNAPKRIVIGYSQIIWNLADFALGVVDVIDVFSMNFYSKHPILRIISISLFKLNAVNRADF